MERQSQERWIVRGRWRVNLAEGLAAHDDGSIFRVVREPSVAICIEASGSPLAVDQLAVRQAQATALFQMTERLVAQIESSRRRPHEGRAGD